MSIEFLRDGKPVFKSASKNAWNLVTGPSNDIVVAQFQVRPPKILISAKGYFVGLKEDLIQTSYGPRLRDPKANNRPTIIERGFSDSNIHLQLTLNPLEEHEIVAISKENKKVIEILLRQKH